MYVSLFFFELLPRVELGTSSLPRMRSTTELKQQHLFFSHLISNRAEDGAQTRDPQLGRLVLYRLSYFRISSKQVLSAASQHNQANLLLHSTCTEVPHFFEQDVGGDGFEPPKAKASRFTVCPIWPLW